jgi:ribose/xylose/arabinose/galactoside ABC-type transport system permease subunit
MIGKWILIFGVVLVVVGVAVWLIESLGLPLGRLPGDIQMRGKGWFFSFPIVTCIVVSIVLTVVLNLLFWFWRR